MLAIISPWKGLVYWLDPAGVENKVRENARKIIYEGLVKFSMVHRKDLKKIKKNPKVGWNKLKCPRQPQDAKYCRYYVCRYMLETIESRQQLILEEFSPGAASTYSQESIDQVRDLWISYVVKHRQQKLEKEGEDLDDVL
ncbi:uncharacterized protein LOC130809879 [Amaranthus tricolor]|uniref:uncharacterized protein LOC130809879 n=1 Tax=Amaranthus tricolor TaxID=29722 RepID=UPI00258EDC5F|nr:uncharacterized protein LOC130809879 [Amaranthus tricolor]